MPRATHTPHPAIVTGLPPGAPVPIPIEPRPGQILFGLLLGVLGVWMLLDWVPSHRPMDALQSTVYIAEGIRSLEDRTDHWMFKPSMYPLAWGLAVLLALAGVEQIIVGATYRAHRESHCRKCNMKVVAKKAFTGLRCPNGGHTVQASIASWVLLGLLGLLLALVLAAVNGVRH